MSQDLPLWNDDETDVLPQYQYSFGHVLIDTAPKNGGYEALFGKFLGLKTLSQVMDFDASQIPTTCSAEFPVLSKERECHFIVTQVRPYGCIFGPHHFFLRATDWIKWNKRVGGLMAFSSQISENDYFYTVFEKGVRRIDACASGNELRLIAETPIEAYLQRKLIFKTSPAKLDTGCYEEFLRHDMQIQYGRETGITIEPRFPAFIESDAVIGTTHYVFTV